MNEQPKPSDAEIKPDERSLALLDVAGKAAKLMTQASALVSEPDLLDEFDTSRELSTIYGDLEVAWSQLENLVKSRVAEQLDTTSRGDLWHCEVCDTEYEAHGLVDAAQRHEEAWSGQHHEHHAPLWTTLKWPETPAAPQAESKPRRKALWQILTGK